MKRSDWLDRQAGAPLPYYCLITKEADFLKLLKKSGVTEQRQWVSAGKGGTTHFIVNKAGNDIAIVCIEPAKGTEKGEAYALLVHEAVHIWQQYAADINEHMPSSEFEAYTIQGISQALMYAFDRATLSKKVL